jgi:hypothetical protein
VQAITLNEVLATCYVALALCNSVAQSLTL